MNEDKKDVVIHKIEHMLSRMDIERVETFGLYFENGREFIALIKEILDTLKS